MEETRREIFCEKCNRVTRHYDLVKGVQCVECENIALPKNTVEDFPDPDCGCKDGDCLPDN